VSSHAPDLDDIGVGERAVVVQNSEEFVELRRRFRKFVIPMTAAFLTWYFLYVFLAVFAHGFMAHKLVGNITVGLVFGLLQFVSTFTITMVYRRWADREFDPRAEALAAHQRSVR
jgi:uncharacterized membrane protein (DUF485 family)